MEVKKTKLKNGVRIVTGKMPHLMSVSMGIWADVGARDESLEQNGLSHFTEHMLFKGTSKRDVFDIARQFDRIGGNSNAFTSYEQVCCHAKVISCHLNPMIDILSDIFINSVFDEEEAEKERGVILQESLMIEEAPDENIHSLAHKDYWGDHPLGRPIIGTPENIASFKSDTIKDFFMERFLPDRTVISAAGNIEHENFVKLVTPIFEKLERTQKFPKRTKPVKMPGNVYIHEKDTELVHICLSINGLSITDERRYPFTLLNSLLGGNMSSRLFQNIREQKGLAYSVCSFTDSYIDGGILGIYAAVDPDKTEMVIEIIIKEVERLKDQGPSESELLAAKEYVKSGFMMGAESSDNQMARLAKSEINFKRYIDIKEVIDKIERTKISDLIQTAKDTLNPKDAAITVLGPVPGSCNLSFFNL